MESIKVGEKALAYFLEGYLCSEAVLMAFCEAFHIDSPYVPSMATAFGSGMARTNDACGALNGGILALSLVYGRKSSSESYEKLYAKVALLKAQFNQQFSSCACSELLGFSLQESDAKEKFGKFNCKEKCMGFVAFSAQTVCEIVLEDAP